MALPNLGEAMVEGHKQYLLKLLDAIIKEKEKEEKQLQASLNIITIVNQLYETTAMVHNNLEKSCLIPQDPKKLLNKAMQEDAKPDLVPGPHAQAIYSSLIHKMPNLVAHIIVLSCAHIVAKEQKWKKKKELKDVATATAGEFVPNKSSITKMVVAQVKQQMNVKKSSQPGKGAKGGKKKKDASGGNPKKNSDKQSKALDSTKAKSKKSKNAKRYKGKGKEKSS